VTSARRQSPQALGTEGGGIRGLGEEELGGDPAGAAGAGAGTATGVGVGLRRRLHGTMGLIMEPASNHSGRGTDGSGSTSASRKARGG